MIFLENVVELFLFRILKIYKISNLLTFNIVVSETFPGKTVLKFEIKKIRLNSNSDKNLINGSFYMNFISFMIDFVNL